jgi:hypothetical protein
MKNIATGLMILCLTAWLTGCATSEPEVIRVPYEKVVVEKVKVPDELLRECPEPNLDALETTGDLERVAGEALLYLKECNEDKAKIREWQSE